MARDLEVNAMPTFVLYKDGKVLENRIVGGNVKQLETEIKSLSS